MAGDGGRGTGDGGRGTGDGGRGTGEVQKKLNEKIFLHAN